MDATLWLVISSIETFRQMPSWCFEIGGDDLTVKLRDTAHLYNKMSFMFYAA